jgi:hypothetical protein
MNVTPDWITELKENEIFVFGSNQAGRQMKSSYVIESIDENDETDPPKYWRSGGDFNQVWHWKINTAIRFAEEYDALQVIESFREAGVEKITGRKLIAREFIYYNE